MNRIYLGLDLGSISINVAVIEENKNILEEQYIRIEAQPIKKTINILTDICSRYQICGIASTGSGGRLIAQHCGALFVNEIIAQTKASAILNPHIKTIIEIGGEDSKLIIIEDGDLVDFSTNTICAAGCGSFLEQQANRLGYSIEEFSLVAVKSKKPPKIAGRCSVFAKSDTIHLQQNAVPDYDIAAALCKTIALNFISNIGRGKILKKPIAIHGGVAANKAVIKYFEEILSDKVTVPKYFASMGAIGAVFYYLEKGFQNFKFKGINNLEKHLNICDISGKLAPLSINIKPETKINFTPCKHKIDSYLGIDIGSLSTNLVVIDINKNILAKKYLKTEGKPIEAVKNGLSEISKEIGDKINISGIGTTGSGRYMIGDFVGADMIVNEITAQAEATLNFDSSVDTIFEIGGQDSKYISIHNGVIIDFTMNKVCAAGTGSFLEEQAERLGINIINDFERFAAISRYPVLLGERCTVFIDSDINAAQQKGISKEDIIAGLAYSIVNNYLNKVVEGRKIGNYIYFQGGVASNAAIVAAFQNVLGKKIKVAPHNDVTGAIGVALLTLKEKIKQTKFKGFELAEKKYNLSTFECRDCLNRCDIGKIEQDNTPTLLYGGRCEKYETKKSAKDKITPNLFEEREKILLESYEETSISDKKKIGIPRILFFYELFPFWNKFFKSLGFQVILSDKSSNFLIQKALENVSVETCFPIMLSHGHILNLIKKGVEYIFLPSLIHMEREDPNFSNNYVCPLVQAIPYIIKHSNIDCSHAKIFSPIIDFQKDKKHLINSLTKSLEEFKISRKLIAKAVFAAENEQKDFYAKIRHRGKNILDGLHQYQNPVAILGRPYAACDPALNISLINKLINIGFFPIPSDFLPTQNINISTEYQNMYWKYGQRILAAARYIKDSEKLSAIYLSSFRCGPDSFIAHLLKDILDSKPYLQLEVDEHTGDVGLITRCEAFLNTLRNTPQKLEPKENSIFSTVSFSKIKNNRKVYIFNMCDHAQVLAGILKSYNIESEVLPPSNKESLKLGRKFSSGKECLPFIVTLGDLLHKIETNHFEEAKSALLLPTANGPCRFGQYCRIHKRVLESLGYRDIPIISPEAKDSYSKSAGLGMSFRRTAWQASLATDLLYKLKLKTRPYEINKGETDEIYKTGLDLIIKTFENKKDIGQTLKKIKNLFDDIPIDKSVKKPKVGIVGEIFVRFNNFCNLDIVDKIEKLGGETEIAAISEWGHYTTFCSKEDSFMRKNYLKYLGYIITKNVQIKDEKKLSKIISEKPQLITEKLLEFASAYLHPSLRGEATLSIGKAIEYIKEGASGIVNLLPFTCMPGTIVMSAAQKLREQYSYIPWLDIAVDGDDNLNNEMKIEAFMNQVSLFPRF